MKDYKELFVAFIETPNEETFLKIRNIVISHDDYAPYDDEPYKRLETLYSFSKYEQLIDTTKEIMMPNWLLSPRIHMLASMAEEKLTHSQNAQMEMLIAQACMEGIWCTGDGSDRSPFLITRILDEYDILMKLNKEVNTQALQKSNGKHLDNITCTDGTEIVFDITDCYATLQKK